MCSEVNKMRRISRCFLTTLCLVFAVFIDLSQGSQRSGSTLNEDYDGGGAGGGGTDGHDDEQGYCAPYNGKVCKAFITGQVWYSRDDPNGGWQNEQITAALWDELISDLTGLCRSAAEVIIHSKASVILLFMGVGREWRNSYQRNAENVSFVVLRVTLRRSSFVEGCVVQFHQRPQLCLS